MVDETETHENPYTADTLDVEEQEMRGEIYRILAVNCILCKCIQRVDR